MEGDCGGCEGDVLTPPEEKKKSRDLRGCLGCEGDKARKCARSLQIPTFCFVVNRRAMLKYVPFRDGRPLL